jgi:mannose-1-phosphate guanylyltransferase
MYAVIMAGGGGTRLHPLSRPERPKPFLPLLPSGETLLQATARRLPTDDITVVTDRRYERFVRDQLPDAHLLLEPMGRNTAAAIALATIAIDRPDDEVMLVVPADAYIQPDSEGIYTKVLRDAEPLARDAFEIHDPLVTFGVEVTGPATQYGYLIPKLATRRRVGGLDAYELDRFEEKPTPDRAEMLL